MGEPVRATGYVGTIRCDAPGCGKMAIGSSSGGEPENAGVEPPDAEWVPDPNHPEGGSMVTTRKGARRPPSNRTAKPKINFCGRHPNLPWSPDAEFVIKNERPDGKIFYPRDEYPNGGNTYANR